MPNKFPDNQLLLPNGKLITFNDQQLEALNKIRAWLKSDKQFFTLMGHAGTGKQQPIDSLIQTPFGSKKIGDIKTGDLVFGANGKPIKVTGVFPQGIKEAYKITFRDNTFTEAGGEHLWNVWTHKLRATRKPTITLTTNELFKNGITYNYSNGTKVYKYSIPLCNPVEYQEKELPLHPYMLGALIGDGSHLGGTPVISVPDMDKEIIDIISNIKPRYIEIHSDYCSSCPRYRFVDPDNYSINKLNQIFKKLLLNVKSVDRFIPRIYMEASIEQRYELLRGLMDTDGTSRGNRIGYSTSSKRLLNDVIELVQSLGGIAIKTKDDNRYENINYTLNIKMFENPFKLKRKAINWKFSNKNPPSRHIISIEKSRIIEQVCISVDSEDGLYLTDNFIVTHNSSIIKKIIDGYHKGLVVSATTHKAKRVIQNFTGKESRTLHALLGLKPDVNLAEFSPNQPIFSPISPAKITEFNFVIIDEASLINSELYAIIQDKLKYSKTKLLYMGDPCQLPPIGEKISKIFTDDEIEKFELTKVERQDIDNPLMSIYDILRNNLDSLDGGYERKTKLNKIGEGVIFTIDKQAFRTTVLENFKSEEYKKNSDYCKLLAWKNETVKQSNKIIRDELFGDNSDIIEVNDILMGYRTVMNDKLNYIIIENCADYKVIYKSELYENKYGLKGFDVKLREEISKGEYKYDNVFIINANDDETLKIYGQMHDFFVDVAKKDKKQWKKYYEFRRNNLLMKTIKTYANGQYRNGGDVINSELDYGYALTIHRSQGSTYTKVMIINDIIDNRDIRERNKLMYVALSRPITSAIVLTTRID